MKKYIKYICAGLLILVANVSAWSGVIDKTGYSISVDAVNYGTLYTDNYGGMDIEEPFSITITLKSGYTGNITAYLETGDDFYLDGDINNSGYIGSASGSYTISVVCYVASAGTYTDNLYISFANPSATENIPITATVVSGSLPSHTVSFSVDYGVAPSSLTGSSITLPAIPAVCSTASAAGWEPYGWATASVAVNSNSATIVGAPGASYSPDQNRTLYAVYKKLGTTLTSSTGFVLQDSRTDDKTEENPPDRNMPTSGYVLLTEVNNGQSAISNSINSTYNSYINMVEYDDRPLLSGTTMSTNNATCVWEISYLLEGEDPKTTYWTFRNITNGKYLALDDNAKGVLIETLTDYAKWYVPHSTKDGYYFQNKQMSCYYLTWDADKGWKGNYKGATCGTTNGTTDNVHVWLSMTATTSGDKYQSSLPVCVCHVTYDANGADDGNVPTDAMNYSNGATVTVKGNTGSLERTGYTFGGWNTKANGTGTTYSATAPLGTFTITDNITLYAKWDAITTTITLAKNCATGSNGTATIKYDATTFVSKSDASNSASQYHLDGYYTTGGSPVKVIDANGSLVNAAGYVTSGKWSHTSSTLTLNAHWALNTHALHWYKNAEDADDLTGSYTDGDAIEYGASITAPNTPTRTGYEFLGWATSANGSTTTPESTMPNSDLAYYAKWSANTITLTLNKNGGVSDGASASVVFHDEEATIGTNAAWDISHTLLGYYAAAGGNVKVLNTDGSFAGANIDGYISDGKWINATNPTPLYAHWATETRTVSYNMNGHGGDTPPASEPVELSHWATEPTPAPSDIDWNFDGWYTASEGGTKWTFTEIEGERISADKELFAHWSLKTYEHLIFACVDISVVSDAAGKALITSRYEEDAEHVSKNINVMATNPIHVTVSGALEGHTVDISSATGLKFYKLEDGRYKDLSVAANKLVAPLTNQAVYVSYCPTSAGTDGAVQSNLPFTISCDGESQEFNTDGAYVKARNLPANMAIVAKVGNTWHALSAHMTKACNPADTLVSVTDESGILTAHGSSNMSYKLWPVRTVNSENDRFGTATAATPNALYGDRVRFAGVNNYGLWAQNDKNTSTKIRNYAAIASLNTEIANEPYEWIVTTTEEDGQFVYTLQTDQSNNKSLLRLWGGKWGTYAYGMEKLYMLPLDVTDPAEMQVYEWDVNQLAVRYIPDNTPVALTNVIVGSHTIASPTVTLAKIGSSDDLYSITGISYTDEVTKNLQDNPSDQLVINVTENGSAKQAIFQIPLIVTATKSEQQLRESLPGADATERNALAKSIDVVIRNGGKLTTGTASGNFANLYIYPGGKAELSQNTSFSNIYLRGGFSWLGSAYALPRLYVHDGYSISGIESEGNGVYYDLYLNSTMYYMTAFPANISLDKVTNEEGTGEFKAWIKRYNGGHRAGDNDDPAWVYVTDGSLARGVGYEIAIKKRNNRPYGILRFPLLEETSWSSEVNCTPTVTAWGMTGGESSTLKNGVTANNAGWNLMGNPFYTDFHNNTDSKIVSYGFKQHGDPWDGSYDWDTDGGKTESIKYFSIPYYTIEDWHDERAIDAVLDAFYPFGVQVRQDGVLSFVSGNRSLMPARRRAVQEREVLVDFLLKDANGNTDKAGLTINNEYSELFDSEDMEKTITGGTKYMKVYTMVESYRTAYNSLPEAAAAQPIPVGYIAPAAGEYTFTMKPGGNYGQVEKVILTDYEKGASVDLLTEDYPFETKAGEINTRFAINVVLKAEVPTDIEDAINDNDIGNGPLKFIWQDKMYILYNGIIYDAVGKKVKTINK